MKQIIGIILGVIIGILNLGEVFNAIDTVIIDSPFEAVSVILTVFAWMILGFVIPVGFFSWLIDTEELDEENNETNNECR